MKIHNSMAACLDIIQICSTNQLEAVLLNLSLCVQGEGL